MLVRDCMTEDVFTVRFDKKLLAASEIMNWHRLRHVPVVDEEHNLVGIITHRDLLRASVSSVETAVSQLEGQQHLWTVPIKQVMQTDVLTVKPDATVQEAATLMRRATVGGLPVVSRGKLVGIITEHDLLGVIEKLMAVPTL